MRYTAPPITLGQHSREWRECFARAPGPQLYGAARHQPDVNLWRRNVACTIHCNEWATPHAYPPSRRPTDSRGRSGRHEDFGQLF
jgi:hypothetical protein